MQKRPAADIPDIASARASSRGEIEAIQYGRALAALAVFFFHLDLATQDRFGSVWWSGWMNGGSYGVEFFFVISGFIILHVHRADIGRPDKLGGFLAKRFIRLYPIYWVIAIPLGLLTLKYVAFVSNRDFTASKMVWDVLLVPREGTRLLGPTWTLQHELVFYLIFSLLILSTRIGVLALIVWQLACLITLAFGLIPSAYQNTQPLARLIGHENFGFLIGMAVAFYYGRYGDQHRRARQVLGSVGVIGMAAILVLLGRFGSIFPNAAVATLTSLVFCAMIVIGMLTVRDGAHPRLKRTLGLLGSASYVLYLVHEPIIAAMVKILHWLKVPERFGGSVSAGLIVIVTIAAAIVIHVCVERPMLRTLRRTIVPRSPYRNIGATAS